MTLLLKNTHIIAAARGLTRDDALALMQTARVRLHGVLIKVVRAVRGTGGIEDVQVAAIVHGGRCGC